MNTNVNQTELSPDPGHKEFKIDYCRFLISDVSEISPQGLKDTADTSGFAAQGIDLAALTEESKIEKFLTFWGTFARIGNQIYLNSDGDLRVEHRSESEVIASLDSFRNKPVSLNHPSELILPANSLGLTRGITHEDIKYDRGLARVRITLTDEEAIRAIQETHRQLSAGYIAKVREKKGDWFGDPYTHVQSDIYGNHVALVEAGRAGSLVATHLGKPIIIDSLEIPTSIQLYRFDSQNESTHENDSEEKTIIDLAKSAVLGSPLPQDARSAVEEQLFKTGSNTKNKSTNQINNQNMANKLTDGITDAPDKGGTTLLNIDGVDISLSESAAIAVNNKIKSDAAKIDAMQTDKNTLQTQLDTANGTIQAQTAEISDLKEQVDELTEQIGSLSNPNMMRGMIDSRINLERDAALFLPNNKFDSKSDREIMIAVLEKIYGDKFKINTEDSVDTITGAFKAALLLKGDSVRASTKTSTKTAIAVQDSYHEKREPGNDDEQKEDEELSDEQIRKIQMDAYKKNATAPLSASSQKRS